MLWLRLPEVPVIVSVEVPAGVPRGGDESQADESNHTEGTEQRLRRCHRSRVAGTDRWLNGDFKKSMLIPLNTAAFSGVIVEDTVFAL